MATQSSTAASIPLPVLHRTLQLPEHLWSTAKARGQRAEKSVRWIIADALDAELPLLIDALRAVGLTGEGHGEMLVRCPLDDHVLGQLNDARRRTGVPAVQLLVLCLSRH